jgi:ABC-type transporter Mla subunit MlaD
VPGWCGRSRRLLNLALLAESSDEFRQATTDLQQALGAVARDCEEIQRLLMQLAQHAAKIDAGNAKAKEAAIALGYVFTQ